MAGSFSYNSIPTNSPKGSSFQGLQSSITPIGVIRFFAGSVVPNGWLLCNGSAVSRKDYGDLFKVGNFIQLSKILIKFKKKNKVENYLVLKSFMKEVNCRWDRNFCEFNLILKKPISAAIIN